MINTDLVMVSDNTLKAASYGMAHTNVLRVRSLQHSALTELRLSKAILHF